MLGWHVPCDDPRGAACNGARGTSNHLGRQTMEFKRSVLGAVVIGAAAFSGSALAAATGNVGGFSEYMFRGVAQSNGAAVQGGPDYSNSSGLCVGTWIFNMVFAGYKTSEERRDWKVGVGQCCYQ